MLYFRDDNNLMMYESSGRRLMFYDLLPSQTDSLYAQVFLQLNMEWNSSEFVI